MFLDRKVSLERVGNLANFFVKNFRRTVEVKERSLYYFISDDRIFLTLLMELNF